MSTRKTQSLHTSGERVSSKVLDEQKAAELKSRLFGMHSPNKNVVSALHAMHKELDSDD